MMRVGVGLRKNPCQISQELAERNLEEKTTKVVDKSALLQVMDELKRYCS